PRFPVPEAPPQHRPDTAHSHSGRSTTQIYLRECSTSAACSRQRRGTYQTELCDSSSGQIHAHAATAPVHLLFRVEMKTDSYVQNSQSLIARPHSSTFSSSAFQFSLSPQRFNCL